MHTLLSPCSPTRDNGGARKFRPYGKFFIISQIFLSDYEEYVYLIMYQKVLASWCSLLQLKKSHSVISKC